MKAILCKENQTKRRYTKSLEIPTYNNNPDIQPIQTYSNIFKYIKSYYRKYQPIPARLSKSVSAYSSICKLILTYSFLIQPFSSFSRKLSNFLRKVSFGVWKVSDGFWEGVRWSLKDIRWSWSVGLLKVSDDVRKVSYGGQEVSDGL